MVPRSAIPTPLRTREAADAAAEAARAVRQRKGAGKRLRSPHANVTIIAGPQALHGHACPSLARKRECRQMSVAPVTYLSLVLGQSLNAGMRKPCLSLARTRDNCHNSGRECWAKGGHCHAHHHYVRPRAAFLRQRCSATVQQELRGHPKHLSTSVQPNSRLQWMPSELRQEQAELHASSRARTISTAETVAAVLP
jgi:hypothetical protein